MSQAMDQTELYRMDGNPNSNNRLHEFYLFLFLRFKKALKGECKSVSYIERNK